MAPSSTFRLWNIAQIQTTNLIKCGLIDPAVNSIIAEKAVGLFDEFSKSRSTPENSVQYNTTPTDCIERKRRKRRRLSTQTSSLNYDIDTKTGLTTNDKFFEHQRNKGYCQQILPIPEISQLQNVISSKVQIYLTTFDNNNKASYEILHRLNVDATVKLDLWAAVQIGKTAYHANHVHENVFVSGVYYAAIPEGSAPLVFHKSSPISTNDCSDNGGDDRGFRLSAEDQFEIHPEEGLLVIFPPWLLHGVPRPTTTFHKLPRVSFAFNLSGYSLRNPWDVTKFQ